MADSEEKRFARFMDAADLLMQKWEFIPADVERHMPQSDIEMLWRGIKDMIIWKEIPGSLFMGRGIKDVTISKDVPESERTMLIEDMVRLFSRALDEFQDAAAQSVNDASTAFQQFRAVVLEKDEEGLSVLTKDWSVGDYVAAARAALSFYGFRR